MQDLYRDREQSEAKHQILRRYITPFAYKILQTYPSLDFIDGFSGPWKNNDTDNLTDTSIGISLRTLSSVAVSLGHKPGSPRIRCIFNEADPTAYAQLHAFVARSRSEFPLVKICTFQGEFATNAPAIKSAADHSFQLLFVDPTGYTGFPPQSLSHFRGRSTELIVNVMRSFIERFVSGNHRDQESALIGLVGAKRAQYLKDTGLTIESLEAEYLSMLRGTLGYKFAGYSPIHNPDKNQIHFNLAYATNHPEGMEAMRNAEFRALSEHDRNRYKKTDLGCAPSLFDALDSEPEIRGPYLTARKGHEEKAAQVMLDILADHPRGLRFDELSARAQQVLFLKRTELGAEIVKLAFKGAVNDPWKERKGRTPGKSDTIKLLD